MCRPASDREALRGLNVDFCIADLSDGDSLSKAVKGHSAVIHSAADIRYASTPRDLYRTNFEGTRSLARACREQGVERLVHVSSTAAIGIPPAGTVANEEFSFNLENSGLDYHLSKKRAEEAVLEEGVRGLNVVVVNPASGFGPHGKFFRGGEMVYKVRRAAIVPYFLGGICAVHVEDAATGIIAALQRGKPGERYILGGENLTFKDIVVRSAAAFGLNRWPVPLGPAVTRAGMLLYPARFSFATHYTASRLQFYDSGKAARALGYHPRPFSDILSECIAFSRRGPANHKNPGIPVKAGL